jgi:methionyl aminopeptidase
MTLIKTKQQIETMAKGGAVLASILNTLRLAAQPGISTAELDALAEDLCLKHHVVPAFKGYNGYPAALCASVNDVIVHGIPSPDPLVEGDILGLDMGVKYRGLYLDSAITVPIGKISVELKQLLDVTKHSLDLAIAAIKEGLKLGDLGHIISAEANKYGYGVIYDLSGHGIGKKLQEDPSIFNHGQPGTGMMLKAGMTIAVEPMFSQGLPDTVIDRDDWTIRMKDGSVGAHFEHTLVVLKNGCRILT